MAGKKGMRAYPEEFRLMLVKKALEEGTPIRQLTREYELKSPKMLRTWIQLYRATGRVKSDIRRIGKALDNPSAEQRIERLEMELELLKKVQEELRG